MHCLCLWLLLAAVAAVGVSGTKVAYNDRALVIDGERRIIISGSIHYPRSTPEVRTRARSVNLQIVVQFPLI
jgi:hypothetical protein